jgi:hypothetical protein
MESRATSWSASAAGVGLVCAFCAGACSGSKGWQTDGSTFASADGAARTSDGAAADVPMQLDSASGGVPGSGGAITYDGATGRGGAGGAPNVDANTSGRDSALDAAGGTGAVTTTGGSGGRSGSGGTVGSGGWMALDGPVAAGGKTTYSGGGGFIGAGGAGGRGGSGGAKLDAAAQADAAWWQNDAGIKTCPTGGGKCQSGEPSACVISGTYDVYQCNSNGYLVREPDSCPGLLKDGDMCVGQFFCLYPSYWYCDCSAGMGFPAKCGDARDTALLDPWHSPDAPQPPTPPCSADVQQDVACDRLTNHYCARENGVDLCLCSGNKWACSASPCPAVIGDSAPCGGATFCQAGDHTVCMCSTTGVFMCGMP